MASEPVKMMVIPNSSVEACKAQQVVMDDVVAHGYSESAQFAIRLALDEALANAVRHGNAGDPKRHVTIKYHISSRQVRLSIADEGRGFNPDAVPDPTREENLERPSGRGVMLMKAYMSEVRFNKRGNCVTMVKRRNDPGRRPAAE